METLTEADSESIPAQGSDVPTLQHLNAYVRPLLADVWYDLGLQLLDPDDVSKLNTIRDNYTSNSNRACTEMFSLWLQKRPSASWNSLISTIRGRGVDKRNVAHKIEQMLQPLTATTVADDLPTSPSDKSLSLAELFCQSMTVGAAYASLMSKLGSFLKKDELPSLKRALISQLTVPGVKVQKKFRRVIESAKTSDDLLDKLERSSCCNWLDTDLLEALACGSSQPTAYELIKAYKAFLYSKKLNEVLFKSKVQKPYANKVGAKIDMNPNEITIGILLQRRGDLENVILNLGKGKVNIDHVKQGCVEIVCSIQTHCGFIVYKNALHNRHKFHTINLLCLTCDHHPGIYDPWLFDLEEHSIKRKEVFHEYEVATQLCDILLENTPVDDIITVFRSHDLLMGDDLTAVANAPSDHLKKMFLLRFLQNVSLSVWSTICAVMNKSKILKHLSDQLVKVLDRNLSVSTQFEGIATDTDNNDEQQPLVTEALHGTNTMKIASLDDTVTATLPHPLLSRSFSFSQLNCLKYLKPSTVEQVFWYTVKHIIELLSCCDPKLLIKWCKSLMASDTHEIKLFTPTFLDKIKQLETSAAILKILSHYWTWSNYSTLSTLAQFSNLALDMLEEFGRRLNTMLPITEYPVASLAVSMFPYSTSSYTVLALECDHKLNHSLQLVYDMQSVITENCHITQHALLLLAVDNNPTRLHWMIPKSVVTIVNTGVIQCSQLLFSKGVMKIFIYPSTMHVLDAAKSAWPYKFSDEYSKSSEQLKQQFVQKQKENENYKSEIELKDRTLDDFRKNQKALIKMNSDLKLQLHKLTMNLEESNHQLAECQKHYKDAEEIFTQSITALEEELQILRAYYSEVDDERNQLKCIVDEKDREVQELEFARDEHAIETSDTMEVMKNQLQQYASDFQDEKIANTKLFEENMILQRLIQQRDEQIDYLQKELTKFRSKPVYRCDNCGTETEVRKFGSDVYGCLQPGHYHFFCTVCSKMKDCPLHPSHCRW